MYKGHISGRVVREMHSKFPYKVVMVPAVGPGTEPSFSTMREAEAFIRRNTPTPSPALSSLYDRAAGES